MMRKHRLVVIDDQPDTLELLTYNLTKEEYEVKNFVNAVDALKYITQENTDLVITDWMLPEMDGLDFCRNMKHSAATQDIPIVMITCRNDEIDVVTALEVGAEEYIAKPFRIREMLTRIKKILKRVSREGMGKDIKESRGVTVRGKLAIDLVSYKVYLQDIPLELTIGEFKLLELLARQPGKVFSRNQIIERINGADHFATERSIDVQIVGLRKKLGIYKEALQTVRSVGYRFDELAIQ